MVNDKISPLQLTSLRKLPVGMTESNHLSQFWLSEPEKMDGVLAYAFGTKNENVLSMLTGGLGNTKFIGNRQYQWDLHGQADRRLMLSRNHNGGGVTPGISGATFKIYFDEKFFYNTDVLVSAHMVQVRVCDEPYQDGTDWVYTVQKMSESIDFVDPLEVDLGGSFSKDYSIVGEFSDKGGGTNNSAPMKLQNQLSTLRKQFACTRSAATDVMVMELFSDDGQSTKMWTKLQEWNFICQWYKEIDKNFIYSEYNSDAQGYTNLRDQNGRPIYTGAGIRQQISPANRREYTRLTYQILDDFLLDLSYTAKIWGGDTKFVALTGKMGMREFDRAIKEYNTGNSITITDSGTFIKGNGNDLVSLGHFKTVEFMNGVTLTVKEFEPYDDLVRNGGNLHPVSKKPLESYRFTILDFGTTANGKANIRKVAKKDSDNAMWYVAGSTTPFGEVAKSMSVMRSSTVDGYEVHRLAEVGIMMDNPLSCGELVCIAE